MNYDIVSLKDRYDLFEQQDNICKEVWPEFMRHDPIANKYWMQLIERFKDYQLLIMDGSEIFAIINTVPLYFDKSIDELPDKGWDWGVKKSITDYEAGKRSNILMGVQIVVNRNHQGKGLSFLTVKEMSKLAAKKRFNKLVIPVRPSNKHKFPLISMNKYIKWKNEKGLPFDNWLRVHIKAGGEIIKTCSKAMKISGTIEEWQDWTKLDFPGSGSYVIPDALTPISIDVTKNKGVYVEPNIWILHET